MTAITLPDEILNQLPDDWLVVATDSENSKRSVLGVYASEAEAQHGLAHDEMCELYSATGGWRLDVVKDSPNLDVTFPDGVPLRTPSGLRARENWFQRYQAELQSLLKNPRRARVFTYAVGELVDPLTTHWTTPNGPCPMPKGSTWPVCGYCDAPMSFAGVLDFRESPGAAPRGSLVFHGCYTCGPIDDKSNSIAWIRAPSEIEMLGVADGFETMIGAGWDVIDYGTPEQVELEVGRLADEYGAYFNFASWADKVGGQLFWIQEDETPRDRDGRPMRFIGQFVGNETLQIADSGIACVFYSDETDETELVVQYF